MPEVKLNQNLNDVPENIEEGWHAVQVVDGEIKESAAGNTYVKWKLELVDENSIFKGWSVPYITMIDNENLPYLIKFFNSLGFEYDGDAFHTEDVIGLRCEALTRNGEWNGQVRPEVKAVRPL